MPYSSVFSEPSMCPDHVRQMNNTHNKRMNGIKISGI